MPTFQWSESIPFLNTTNVQIRAQQLGGDFASLSKADFFSPFDLRNMDVAVQRILIALEAQETIAVYGHDDADGVTAAFLVTDFLRRQSNARIVPYIPHRELHGHGLIREQVDFLHQQKVDLIITVDGCSSAHDAIAYAKTKGITTIITDHHILPEKLPDSYTIINPKRNDRTYPFRELSGAGVAFKLVQALAHYWHTEIPDEYCFWTALGTYMDKMPLHSENRVWMKLALETFIHKKFDYPFLPTFYQLYYPELQSIDPLQNVIHLFSLLNGYVVQGRSPQGHHQLFALMNSSDVSFIREQLIALQDAVQANNHELDETRRIATKLAASFSPENLLIVVDEQGQIPYRTLGFAANVLLQEFDLPTIVIRIEKETAKGEARGPQGVQFVDLFKQSHPLFTNYGGHPAAAGFSCPTENLQILIKELQQNIVSQLPQIVQSKDIIADFQCTLEDASTIWQLLQPLCPFGMHNALPWLVFPHENGHNLLTHKDIVWLDREKEKISIHENEKFHVFAQCRPDSQGIPKLFVSQLEKVIL